MPFLQLVTAHPVPAPLAESLAGAFGRALGLPPGAVIVQRVASGPGPGPGPDLGLGVTGAVAPAGGAVPAPAETAEAVVPGETSAPAEVAREAVVDAGAVIVVRGRRREAAAMREAVARAGTLLAEGLGLDPDLVLVSWPDPGVVATGGGVLS
ncbi:hypothetical protein [Streptosporangium sp. NPDC002524]|uniref:hypothetical protein n=1 Tax=Streptosporangium sp. NPDC002524 TaxID=3154537 RepID=UPI00331C1CC7